MGTGDNYSKKWTYNWLGDIVSSPDKGSYAYAGNTGGSYANPDAVTSNASSTYTYDNNGNLLTGDSFTNTWDYRNRLTQTQLNGTTTSYLYDINDERIAEGANSATTTYPFTFYNVATSSGGAATFTKHIFANGEPVADVQGSTTTAKVYYIHDDALGGANVLSNASGTLAEVIEYYPFGGIRLDQRATSTPFGEQRRFTGHEFDTGTGLNYMDARYEGPTLSRFLSEDPNFIAAGAPDWVTGMPADPTYAGLTGFVNTKNVNYLENPQNLSSYTYVNNNPLRYRDPDGKQLAPQGAAILLSGFAGYDVGFLGAFGGDIISHLSNGDSLANAIFPTSDRVASYANSGLKGAVVAAGTTATLMAAPGTAIDYGSSAALKFALQGVASYNLSTGFDITQSLLRGRRGSLSDVDTYGNISSSLVNFKTGNVFSSSGATPTVNLVHSAHFVNEVTRGLVNQAASSAGSVMSGLFFVAPIGSRFVYSGTSNSTPMLSK